MPLKPITMMTGIPQLYMVEMRTDPRCGRNKHSFRITAIFTLSREIEDIVNRTAYPRSRARSRSYSRSGTAPTIGGPSPMTTVGLLPVSTRSQGPLRNRYEMATRIVPENTGSGAARLMVSIEA